LRPSTIDQNLLKIYARVEILEKEGFKEIESHGVNSSIYIKLDLFNQERR